MHDSLNPDPKWPRIFCRDREEIIETQTLSPISPLSLCVEKREYKQALEIHLFIPDVLMLHAHAGTTACKNSLRKFIDRSSSSLPFLPNCVLVRLIFAHFLENHSWIGGP